MRGPQSALFGRNTLGGVINVTSARPSLSDWSGARQRAAGELRRARRRAAACRVRSRPARVGVGVSFKYGRRDGYTVNIVTGNDLDIRDRRFSARRSCCGRRRASGRRGVIVTGERARDGDYALSDLGGLRTNPFRDRARLRGAHRSRHRWRRRSWRDGQARASTSRRPQASCAGRRRTPPTSTTRRCRWCAATTARRASSSRRRCASRRRRTRRSGSRTALPLRWQAGVFLFTQNYEQDAVNTFAPFVLSPFIRLRRRASTRPQSALDDVGVGVYGQGTVTVGEPRRSDGRRARRPRDARTRR